MAAYKVRGLGWIVCCMVVVPACCFATSFGASERIRLNSVDAKIRVAEKEILAYETEFAARANQLQLEHWSVSTPGIGAPQATQFVAGEEALASLGEMPAAAPRQVATIAPAEVRMADNDPRDSSRAPAAAAARPPIEKVAMLDERIVADLRQLAAAEAQKLR